MDSPLHLSGLMSRALQSGQSSLYEVPLGAGLNQLQSTTIGDARLVDAAEATEKLRTRGVQIVVLLKLEEVDQRERRVDVPGFGHRRGSVQLHDRGVRDPGQFPIERSERGPVLGVLQVECSDLRLQRVLAVARQRESASKRRASLCDLALVPQGAVLVAQEYDRPVRDTGSTSCVVQQHQRQQAVGLGLIRHELSKQASEAYGLGGESSAAVVAPVEDEVDDGEHRGEATWQQAGRRHAERDAPQP